MLRRIRAIIHSSPRASLAIFLAATFPLIHLASSKYANSQKNSVAQDYTAFKTNLQSPPIDAPSTLYAQAAALLHNPFQKLLETPLFYDLLSDKPDPEKLITSKLIYDQSNDIRPLLRQAREKEANSLGAITSPEIKSLIALCVDSAFYCIETGALSEAANLLLDAWRLDRLSMNNIGLVFTRSRWLNTDPQLQLCIRRLGMRLTPDNDARQGVKNLIAALLDESYVLSSYAFAVDDQLARYDIYRGKFPLLEPLFSIQNARQLRMVLDHIRRIKSQSYDPTMLDDFIPTHPCPPPHYNLQRTYFSFIMPADMSRIFLADDPQINRLTALSLACQLHRVDHNAWPTTLDPLAPRYIPYIPRSNLPILITQLKFPGFDRFILASGRLQSLLYPAYYIGNSALDIVAVGSNFADLTPFPTHKADILTVTPITADHLP